MKKFLFTYFFFLVFLLSFFVSGLVDSQDGFQYLAVARNIYYTHEPTAPVYEFVGIGVGQNIHMSTHVGKNGKTYSATGLGFSLSLLPAVAVTDIVYRIYNLTPPIHFPLENDWLILLTASFTNVFFAAGIGVVLYAYLRELKVSHKSALITSLLGLLTTNLFVASKHIYAHTMFTFFLFASFLLIKIHSRKKQNLLLLLSGIFWGIAMLTYNVSFLITAIPYFTYFLWFNLKSVKRIFWVIAGVVPFYILNSWYANLTAIPTSEYATIFFKSAIATPIGVFYEGLYGQLLSPGRSYFIYSPILLLIFIFWFKIKKNVLPETAVFFLLFGLYVLSLSLSWLPDPKGFADSYWHGEYSWGPRYLISTIPFGLVLTGYLYDKIKKIEKILIFVPLALVGLYVEILGIPMHYQIKFHNLEPDFTVNGVQYNSPVYSNFLPRFSPLISMSKNLVKLIKTFPQTINNGDYNVRFTDGIDFAFSVGPERWRAIDKSGYILFDNNSKTPITSLSFDLINHPVGETDSPSKISFLINGQKVNETNLKITERKKILLEPKTEILKAKDNLLIIQAEQADYTTYFDKKQILAIIDMHINDNPINKESINVPYISKLGPAVMGTNYQNWGNNSNPWLSWHIHTQVVERTPYFWWLYPLYYWDIPATPYLGLLAFNTLGFFYFTKKLFT